MTWALAQALGLDVGGLTKAANEILGHEYGSPRDMTAEEANKVIMELERRKENAQPEKAAS